MDMKLFEPERVVTDEHTRARRVVIDIPRDDEEKDAEINFVMERIGVNAETKEFKTSMLWGNIIDTLREDVVYPILNPATGEDTGEEGSDVLLGALLYSRFMYTKDLEK